ncbi:hypothetical protein DERF_000624 [Dermatophagoides farinae]|uniref:Uncharacterized protein n=1 Tax=Dermatophagoides farinae TaxID=6954 RepID=A0A922ID93_DERFA|nr:hypothetical protein DERF_000624 [Dermatophagoides farinae]
MIKSSATTAAAIAEKYSYEKKKHTHAHKVIQNSENILGGKKGKKSEPMLNGMLFSAIWYIQESNPKKWNVYSAENERIELSCRIEDEDEDEFIADKTYMYKL